MNNVNSVFPFIDELLMNDDGWRIMDHGPPPIIILCICLDA